MPDCVLAGCNRKRSTYRDHLCARHHYRLTKYGDPFHSINRSQHLGIEAENKVRSTLCAYGRKVESAGPRDSYDLLVDGLRVEVKCAARQHDGKYSITWKFNLHRHGVLSEQTDLYILRLEEVPYSKAAIHMLFKAPMGVTTISVSMRALLNQDWAAAVSDFYAFAKGEYGRKEVAA